MCEDNVHMHIHKKKEITDFIVEQRKNMHSFPL